MLIAFSSRVGLNACLASFFAVWLLLASFASVSPALHASLHGHSSQPESIGCSDGHQHCGVSIVEEESCEDPKCGIVILGNGVDACFASLNVSFMGTLKSLKVSENAIFAAIDRDKTHRSRAPPYLS